MFQYFLNINLRKCAQDTTTEFSMHDARVVSCIKVFVMISVNVLRMLLVIVRRISALFFEYEIVA